MPQDTVFLDGKPYQYHPLVIGRSEWLVRDCLDAMREHGIESRTTPEELRRIARGDRDIRSVLV